ncbi:MAG: response regulator transcription factor [Curvibacter lanceolatus]|jgi:two-component system nitrate/nitrite response regulator NarL|uniref:response regulator n=1 Tax=Curvibacter lanceolatus TaxID=86182 RepID=UPI00039F5273|nr:response regulator transcription factor [Curvibacter lanceolatus]MBV5293675.1 response regulator transcription factor [Curvibacter lanceolatus]
MTLPAPIRLLVVDDHKLFRRGLVALLSQQACLQVVAEATDAGEALKLAAQHAPEVVLLDNHLPGVHGVDALPQLMALVPAPQVIMLTVSEDAEDLSQALARGASGYLLKTVDGDELVASIRRVREGQSVVSPEMTGKLFAAYRQAVASAPMPEPVQAAEAAPEALPTEAPARPPEPGLAASKLSPREREILREIARGASNKEIARTLKIAETTVKIHVQHIFRKLNLSSRVQAAVYAVTDPDQA